MKFDVEHPKTCACGECMQQRDDCLVEMMGRVGYLAFHKFVRSILNSIHEFDEMQAMGEDEVCLQSGEDPDNYVGHCQLMFHVSKCDERIYNLVQKGEPDEAEKVLPALQVAMTNVVEHLQMLTLIYGVPCPMGVE